MDTLYDRLRAGTNNPPKQITWPGTDIAVGLRVLSDQDHLDAGLAADRLYKNAGVAVAMQNVEDYEQEKQTQRLYRALCNPDNPRERVAPSVDEFRRMLTDGVRTTLIDELNAYQSETSPDPLDMSEEEFDALLLRVKKNPVQTASSISNIFCARKLIASLAKARESLPPDNGSTS